MLILVFDTSTKNGTVGWVKVEDGGGTCKVVDYAHTWMPAVPGHAERLLERIDTCLKSGGYGIGDVDLMVIGRGPGTFTGLRIGFSTAKTLSLANGIPMVTLSTLEMLACSSGAQGSVAALIDARRGEVYAGLFWVERVDGLPTATPIAPEAVMEPHQVPELIDRLAVQRPIHLVGDGANVYAAELAQLGEPAFSTSVELNTCVVALHGYHRFRTEGPAHIATSEPVYLREPDARKPKAPFGAN